jgi:exodeoxyribonuclease (lambda-induced)
MLHSITSWIEKEKYWILNVDQRSDIWYKVRIGRCTSSIISACIGRNRYKTPEQALREIKGEIIPCNRAMLHGIRYEGEARMLYEVMRGTKISQIGFAIPKWNYYIGCSTDGLVGDNGIIEIKCPVKRYRSLDILKYRMNGKNCNIRDFIDESHYIQMQCGMAILDREWCDYIVYYHGDEEIIIHRVPFDKQYWDCIYSEIASFIKNNAIDKLDNIIMPK